MLITTGIKQMAIKAYHLLSTLKSFNTKKCWKETSNFSSWMKINPCKWNCIYHAANQTAATDVFYQSKVFLHKLSIETNGINLVWWVPNWTGKKPVLLFHASPSCRDNKIPGRANRNYPCPTSIFHLGFILQFCLQQMWNPVSRLPSFEREEIPIVQGPTLTCRIISWG